mgnify:CR=1 FL=1
MKKVLAVLTFALVMTGCSNVPPGYTGIKVFLNGGDKGVDQRELNPGRYWLTINEELFTFPTFSQTQVWTKDREEGSRNDDSMTFQTTEGITANSDIDMTRIFRIVYDGLYDYLKPESIPAAVIVLAKYQYQAAFVADQELNLVACLTEIMVECEVK